MSPCKSILSCYFISKVHTHTLTHSEQFHLFVLFFMQDCVLYIYITFMAAIIEDSCTLSIVDIKYTSNNKKTISMENAIIKVYLTES